MPKVTFVMQDGGEKTVEAADSARLLDVAQENGLPMEGACEGSLACSTCHVIVNPEWFAKLKPASEEEEDMLDLTHAVTRESRLACQINVTSELDGLTVALPQSTYNLIGA